MAKNSNIASVLAFEKKLVPSDGFMYGTTWEKWEKYKQEKNKLEKELTLENDNSEKSKLEKKLKREQKKLSRKYGKKTRMTTFRIS